MKLLQFQDVKLNDILIMKRVNTGEETVVKCIHKRITSFDAINYFGKHDTKWNIGGNNCMFWDIYRLSKKTHPEYFL